jgi:ABC-type transport system involved in multi-copper enzyme maturation permease subunit
MLAAKLGHVVSAVGRAPMLVGPLFTKEVLVSSRRPRYYLLRFAYAALLGLFIALVWLGLVESARSGSAAYRTTRMAEMGKQIVLYIVCFQFVAAQLVATVVLSAAISEEIYQRTLVPILTTPIRYSQIVVGKFLGRLLHVLLLLAISLPLMGVVRVLGGVPWGFLLSGVCLTVTAAALTGAVSMFFSIICRRAYLSMLATLGVVLALHVVLGGVVAMIIAIVSAVGGINLWAVALYPNPLAALIYECVVLMNPAKSAPGYYWPLHCVAMGAATGGVLKLCEILVRRSGIRKAIGMHAGTVAAVEPPAARPAPQRAARPPVLVPVDELGSGEALPAAEVEAAFAAEVRAATSLPAPRTRRWKARGWNIREMVGSPIAWRELRKPLLRDKVVQIVVMCGVAFYLLYAYAVVGASGGLGKGHVHGVFVTLFLLTGMLCTAVDAATVIAPEKRARTWPALLSTPVSDWHILFGKAGGTLFRCLPVWLFLAGHLLIFTLAGVIHPLAVVHVGLLGVWTSVFLAGAGLYFSTRCRRATTAILGNVGLALLLWVLLPIFVGLVVQILGGQELFDGLLTLNPAVQSFVVTSGGCTHRHLFDVSGLEYDWPGGEWGWLGTTALVFLSAAAYSLLGLLLGWRAKRLFRRNVFDT